MREKFKRVFKSSSIPYIWKWSKDQHKFVVLLSVINVALAGLSLYFALVTKSIVDAALAGDTREIIKNALIIALVLIIQIISAYAISRLNLYITAKMQMNMRYMVLDQILKKEYASISKFHSGELVNRIFSDVSTVVNGVTSIIPPLLSMITQLVGAIIILVQLDYRFVIVLCGVGIIVFVVTLLFKPTMKRMHKDVQEKEGKVHAAMQETIENSRLIKASNSEERMKNMVFGKQKIFYNAQMRRNKLTSIAGTGLRIMFNISWMFAIVWGCFGIASGQYSYGTLMAIMQLVGRIQSPFRSFSSTLQSIFGTVSSAERLLDILNLPAELDEEYIQQDANELYKELKEIKIDNLDFSYDRGDKVLSNVNLSLKPGDFIAYTGLSGGGKSTLFLLLLGIYKPTSGKIAYIKEDGEIEVGKKTRNVFAYVPQGNILFSGSIKENLRMFNENATDEELIKACEVACIKDYIFEELSDGLDTIIGERGIGLSEGQAQRVAIARAIVSGAPILLLDEATSALDEITEANVLRNIENLKNKTCFIVTHRKAAFKICNRRFHIEDGCITEKELEI